MSKDSVSIFLKKKFAFFYSEVPYLMLLHFISLPMELNGTIWFIKAFLYEASWLSLLIFLAPVVQFLLLP